MKCLACGAERSGMNYYCDCERQYKEDMKNKRYPHGFIYRPELEKAGQEQMDLSQWQEVKTNSNEIKELMNSDTRSIGGQRSLELLIEEQKKIINKINSWNDVRVMRLSAPPLNTSDVHLY